MPSFICPKAGFIIITSFQRGVFHFLATHDQKHRSALFAKMDISKPNSVGTFDFQKQDNRRHCNLYDDNILKQSFIGETFQGRTSCFSQSRNSLEVNGSVYEDSIGESSFGGSFGHDEADGNVFGGNFRSAAADDAQVVPGFNDILESTHVDVDKSNISSSSFLTEPDASARPRQDENCESSSTIRRHSERDELEIYFPCVLTPIPVDRLYSTLADDTTVFKFPATSGEFLPDDEAGHCFGNQLNGSYNSISTAEGGRHSLESFGNLSVFSFPYGSQVQFEELPSETCKKQDRSDSCISTQGQVDNTGEERCFYGDSGPQKVSDKQILPLPATATENNFNFQTFLTNSCRPEGVNTAEDTYGGRVSIQQPSAEIIYSPPFALNATQNAEHRGKFPPNFTVPNNPSVNPVSLEKTSTNSFFFQSRAIEPVVASHEFETGEVHFEHSHGEVFNCGERTFLDLKSSLYSASNNFCQKNSRQTRELSRYSNIDNIKSTATASIDQENSPCMTRTICKVKNSRKLKSIKTDRAHKHGETRDFHNDMEKQRRTNMKARFQNLRLTLPELWDNEKASKIVILQKAFEYIGMLEKESIELEDRKRAERLRNIELLNKLQTITSGKC